jgi:hypothetical protein
MIYFAPSLLSSAHNRRRSLRSGGRVASAILHIRIRTEAFNRRPFRPAAQERPQIPLQSVETFPAVVAHATHLTEFVLWFRYRHNGTRL